VTPATGQLRGLPYYGGKNPLAPARTGAWIASLLPITKVYVEPFAGMFGVGLQRPAVSSEIYNDRDDRVVTWWRAVRDHPDEFARLVEATPHSRQEFVRALERLDHPELLERALAVHIVLAQGMMSGTNNVAANFWYASWSGRAGNPLWPLERVRALALRMQSVQLECRDAAEILERTVKIPDAVIYCDPPYADTDTEHYRFEVEDRDRMAELLARQQGFVAISGYGDEWDRLGWRRHERRKRLLFKPDKAGGRRIEVLWTNYDPHDSAEALQR